MSVYEYHRPHTLAEAWALKVGQARARYVAGGTDLLVRIRAGHERPDRLVSLRHIRDLQKIEMGALTRIGASTSISEVLSHPALAATHPILAQAARPFACAQIRNVATIGGNLCNASPAADMAPALLVLDATVVIAGPSGERKMPLDGFFVGPGKTQLGPDEILTEIQIQPRPNLRTHYLRKGRVRMDLALTAVAVALSIEQGRCVHARVAVGAVAPRPLRVPAVEALLVGHTIDAAVRSEARALIAREVSPITDVRCSAGYRRELTGVLLERAINLALENEPGKGEDA